MKLFLIICFIVLNVLDVLSTYKILSLGGVELNPISRFFIKLHLFIPFKIIITCILVIFIVFSNIFNAIILNGILLFIVYNNYWELNSL